MSEMLLSIKMIGITETEITQAPEIQELVLY